MTANARLVRLLPAGKMLFGILAGLKQQGVVVGGAAALLLGGSRSTTDIDVNVRTLPKIKPSKDDRYIVKHTRDMMMKFTWRDPEKANDIKCDISCKNSKLFDIFLKHSIVHEATGMRYADASLLLALKISSYADRMAGLHGRAHGDTLDILFCLDRMERESTKMPVELKVLYTAEDLSKVQEILAEEFGGTEMALSISREYSLDI
ncbi:hypothetical protein BDZ97DRAFT_2072755 [Flammula alnicola]|nr:hypothetical protein BDZ97DRAFT_2072755 [Flammula alnicola]